MKKFLMSAFVLLTGFAFGQSNNIKVIGNNQTKTLECNQNMVFITGSKNVLTIKGSCKEIKVIGSHNKISASKVDGVYINGDGNSLSYIGTSTPNQKLKSELIGRDNSVTQ
ncbi:DUF3060 domain-containing protein [Vaginella massiliensis]|uniref:DUF3060 domain-containing protein n=1 Tax=Vaginella massiliensis TaxID=1816680 RepID=UPI0037511EDE